MNCTRRRLTGVTAALFLAAAVLPLIAPTAMARTSAGISNDPARIGLYGQQSPTYDGVYRQGLSIIALDSSGADVDVAAIRWLRRQQCGNGSWTSFRPDLEVRCGAADSNATAMAVMALKAVGKKSAATAGLTWLINHQKAGGGWEYSKGWGPDSNSTGLVVQALIAMKVDPTTVRHNGSPLGFLRSLQLGCDELDASLRGALDYQPESPLMRNDFATAQAAQALAGSALPVAPRTGSARLPELSCATRTPVVTTSPSEAAAGYVGRRLAANGGTIPSAFGPGADYGTTANAVLALVAAGLGRRQVHTAVSQLRQAARMFTRDADRNIVPGAAALVVLAENATEGHPRKVDGLNLIRLLRRSITEPTGSR